MSALNRDSKLVARQFFDLYQTSKDLMHQNLRRRYPKASEEEISARLLTWLHSRPGAELGDVGGPIRIRELPEQLR
jgi:hypothetical protein